MSYTPAGTASPAYTGEQTNCQQGVQQIQIQPCPTCGTCPTCGAKTWMGYQSYTYPNGYTVATVGSHDAQANQNR